MRGLTPGSATNAARAAGDDAAQTRPSHLAARLSWFWRRFRRNHIGMAGGMIVIACLLTAAIASVISPYPPDELHTRSRLARPSGEFPLGTDELGRDILSRIIYGSRISLQVGVISVSLALLLGSGLGLIAGFFGGATDDALMRIMDVLFAFPAILLAIGIMAMLGASITNAMIAIGIVYAPSFARLARASVLSLKEMEFVEAARALGLSDLRVIARHILPNLLAPVIVQTTFSLSTAILTEASLSFLGLGTPPPAPSWGSMLSTSRRYVELSPWPAIFPGLAIMIVVLGFNLLGDGLRDVLDPRLRAGD